MRPLCRNLFASALLAMPMTMLGCSPATRSPIVPVRGKIEFSDGAKLPEGSMIVFSPVLGGAGSAMAQTDAEGNFTARHINGASGAEVGDYLIELRSPQGQESEFYAAVPESYTSGGGLAAKVGSDGAELKLVLQKSRRRR